VQPAIKRLWVRQRNFNQKPRGGSRGAVTRIFPAVSPGRTGVVRGRLLAPRLACQPFCLATAVVVRL